MIPWKRWLYLLDLLTDYAIERSTESQDALIVFQETVNWPWSANLAQCVEWANACARLEGMVGRQIRKETRPMAWVTVETNQGKVVLQINTAVRLNALGNVCLSIQESVRQAIAVAERIEEPLDSLEDDS